MRRISGIAAVVVGILLLGGAGAIHWVLVPRMAQLPSDTNTTRIYSGTAAMVANPTIVTGTRIGPGMMRNVPVEVHHNTTVIATHGHQALVRDTRVLTIPGYTLARLVSRFDVDRRTFQPGDAFASATPAVGLTFNWPMGTKPHDYTGWVTDTQQTTRLHYVGAARHGGIDTYVFRTKTAPAPITDPQLLSILPASMTQKQLLETTPSLLFTQKHLLKLADILAKAPNTVPLAYDYNVNATFWVDPTTGVVVDHQQREVRMLNLVVNGQKVKVAPVMDITYGFTPATVTGAAADAKDGAAQLNLLRHTLPVGALIGGCVLVLVGLLLLAVRRRRGDEFDDEALAALLSEESHRVPM